MKRLLIMEMRTQNLIAEISNWNLEHGAYVFIVYLLNFVVQLEHEKNCFILFFVLVEANNFSRSLLLLLDLFISLPRTLKSCSTY